jgi:hypothetical protein
MPAHFMRCALFVGQGRGRLFRSSFVPRKRPTRVRFYRIEVHTGWPATSLRVPMATGVSTLSTPVGWLLAQGRDLQISYSLFL